MAFSTTKVVSRLSSRLQPLALKLQNQRALLPTALSAETLSVRSPAGWRFSLISRLPVELGSVGTMLPLHSAIASARLRSSLAIDSQAWGLVPQGISLPL